MSSFSGSKILLPRLKRETAQQHGELERKLDLLRPDIDRAAYVELLVRFHRIYAAWEPLLFRLIGPIFPEWPAGRSRLGLLEDDLKSLGVHGWSEDAVTFPFLTDVPEALGAMYVFEGSTLGSQFLIRHFERTLGITAESGGSFFNGYGAETGAKWREFAEAAEAYAERSEEHDRIVSGAQSMFEAMQRELCGVTA